MQLYTFPLPPNKFLKCFSIRLDSSPEIQTIHLYEFEPTQHTHAEQQLLYTISITDSAENDFYKDIQHQTSV